MFSQMVTEPLDPVYMLYIRYSYIICSSQEQAVHINKVTTLPTTIRNIEKKITEDLLILDYMPGNLFNRLTTGETQKMF